MSTKGLLSQPVGEFPLYAPHTEPTGQLDLLFRLALTQGNMSQLLSTNLPPDWRERVVRRIGEST